MRIRSRPKQEGGGIDGSRGDDVSPGAKMVRLPVTCDDCIRDTSPRTIGSQGHNFCARHEPDRRRLQRRSERADLCVTLCVNHARRGIAESTAKAQAAFLQVNRLWKVEGRKTL
jgi:hypothetical protein